MRLLLDTHAFLWWVIESDRLSAAAHMAIQNRENAIFISAASAWEIATKHRIGKLPEAELIVHELAGAIVGEGFEALPITVDDAARAGALPGPLRDPFDRMLIAQASSRDLALVSADEALDQYDVQRLW